MNTHTTERKRTIVVGCDGSDRTRDALALGRLLAEARNARIILAAVYHEEHPVWPGSDELEAVLRKEAEETVAGVPSTGLSVPVQLRTVSARSAARGLHELAEQVEADMIVVGSTHRGPIGRVMPGSVGEKLLQEAPCAVAIAPHGFAKDHDAAFRVIAVGYDMSPESRVAVDVATDVAVASKATVRVLSVAEPRAAHYADLMSGAVLRTDLVTMQDHVQKVLTETCEELPPEVRPDGRVLRGAAYIELLRECETGVDLLVLGSRGYGPLGRTLTGSVSTDVVRQAQCPVLVVPRHALRSAAIAERDRQGAVGVAAS